MDGTSTLLITFRVKLFVVKLPLLKKYYIIKIIVYLLQNLFPLFLNREICTHYLWIL